MKPSQAALLSLFLAATPARAEEQPGFDNFLLTSPSIIAPSQSYQVKGGRFEGFAGLSTGSFEGKGVDTTTDLHQTHFAVAYAQTINPVFVLSVDAEHQEQTLKTDGEKAESSDSVAHLGASYGVSSLLAIGASANIHQGDEGAEKYSSTTFTAGLTLHQEIWEASLAYGSSATHEKVPSADIPSSLALHGRYKFMPLLTLGVAAEQRDYQGLDEALTTEYRYRVIAESAFSESSRLEAAFETVQDESGEENTTLTQIILGGAYRIASSNWEVGAQANLTTLDADFYKANINRFLLTFTNRN